MISIVVINSWDGNFVDFRDLKKSLADLVYYYRRHCTKHAQLKFSIEDFFSKCDQIRSFLWTWTHLLKKSSMENFICCALRWLYTLQLHIAGNFQVVNSRYSGKKLIHRKGIYIFDYR